MHSCSFMANYIAQIIVYLDKQIDKINFYYTKIATPNAAPSCIVIRQHVGNFKMVPDAPSVVVTFVLLCHKRDVSLGL